VLIYDVVDSTLEEARKMDNAEEWTIILAREQRNLVSRLGRPWYSPKGGLWFTIITYPNISATTSPILTLTAALAVVKGIRRTTALPAAIRWPNDVYVHGGKVSSILTELNVVGDIITRALVGMGINANFDIDALPPDTKGIATTLKREVGEEIDLERLFSNTIEELQRGYEYYKTGWHYYLINEIKTHMEFIGAPVEIVMENESLIGIFEDLDEIGRMILKIDRDLIKVAPGDVRKVNPL